MKSTTKRTSKKTAKGTTTRVETTQEQTTLSEDTQVLVPEVVNTLDFDGPLLVDGIKHFSPKDLLRYELVQHKIVVAYQSVGLKQVEIEKTRAAFEAKLRGLDYELKDLQVEQRRRELKFKEFQEELSRVYDLDLSKVTYDDTTGLIRVHEPSTEAQKGGITPTN